MRFSRRAGPLFNGRTFAPSKCLNLKIIIGIWCRLKRKNLILKGRLTAINYQIIISYAVYKNKTCWNFTAVTSRKSTRVSFLMLCVKCISALTKDITRKKLLGIGMIEIRKITK